MVSRIFVALGIDAQGAGNARVEATKMYLAAAGAVLVDE
jgi:hypothetical protein